MPTGSNDELARLIRERLAQMNRENAIEMHPDTGASPVNQRTQEIPFDGGEHPLSLYKYVFGQDLPTATTNVLGQPVREGSQVVAGFGHMFENLFPSGAPESQTELEGLAAPTRFLAEAAPVLRQTRNQLLGSAVGNAVGMVDFLATGVALPAARLLAEVPGFGFNAAADQIQSQAEAEGVTFDELVDRRIVEGARSLGIAPDTMKALVPDGLFKALFRPSEEGILVETAMAGKNVAMGVIDFNLEKGKELLSGDVLTDPIGLFAVGTGLAKTSAHARARLKARKTRKAAEVKAREAAPDLNSTVAATLVDSFDGNGRLTTRGGPIPTVVDNAVRAAAEHMLNETPEMIRPKNLKPLFDRPEPNLNAAASPRGVYLPDYVRTAAGVADDAVPQVALVVGEYNGKTLGRAHNGQFVEILEGPMTREQAAATAIPIPDPVVFGETTTQMTGRAMLESDLGIATAAGREAVQLTRNPRLIEEAMTAPDYGKQTTTLQKGPEHAPLAEVVRAEMKEHYGPIFEVIDLLDDTDMLANPEFVSYLDASRKRFLDNSGKRVPFWNLSGYGVPIKAKIASSGQVLFEAILGEKFNSAYEKMGIYSAGVIERASAKIQGVSVTKLQQEFRTRILPHVREPSQFLNKALGKDFTASLDRVDQVNLVTEAFRTEIEGYLQAIGRTTPEAFQTFREGAYEIGHATDAIYWLNAARQKPSLSLNQFKRDYQTHVRPKTANAKPGTTLAQVVDEAALPEYMKPWYAEHRMRDVSAIEKGLADPLMQDQLMIRMNAKELFTEPLIREAAQVDAMVKQGVTADLLREPGKADPQVGTTFTFKPSPRIDSKLLETMVETEKFTVELPATEKTLGRGQAYTFKKASKRDNGSITYEFEALDSHGTVATRRVNVPEGLAGDLFWENFTARVPEPRRRAYRNWINFNLRGETPARIVTQNFIKGVEAVQNAVPSSIRPGFEMTQAGVQKVTQALTTALYAKHLGLGRVSSAFKNLTQGPTLGASIVGSKYYFKGIKALSDPGIKLYMDALGAKHAKPAPLATVGDTGGLNPSTFDRANNMVRESLVLFKHADTFNRTSNQAGALLKVMEEGKDFVPNLPQEGWNNLIRRKIAEGKIEQGAYIYAHGVEAASQWWYSSVNRPEFYLNREFLSIFGTWPLNYAERIAGNRAVRKQRATELVSEGKTGKIQASFSPIKNEQVANSLRYLAASIAIISAGKAADVDLESWLLTGPLPAGIGGGFDLAFSAVEGAQAVVSSVLSSDPTYAMRQIDEAESDMLALSPLPFDTRDGHFSFFGGTGIGRDIEAASQSGSLTPLIFGAGPTAASRRNKKRRIR